MTGRCPRTTAGATPTATPTRLQTAARRIRFVAPLAVVAVALAACSRLETPPVVEHTPIAGGSTDSPAGEVTRTRTGGSPPPGFDEPADPGPSLPRPLLTPYRDLRRHTSRSIGEDAGIDVSPDGRELVFSTIRDGDAPGIFLKDESSPLVRAVTTGRFRDIHPKFSPDGDSIAFASDREGNFDIWIVPKDHPAALEQLTGSTDDEVHPSFSPDGHQVAFCRFSPRHGWNLWIARRNGHTRTELGPGLFPEWSPTGEWIAFERPGGRGEQWPGIWVIRPDGSEVRQVVQFNDRGASQPSWSPDAARIAFTLTHRPAAGAPGPIEEITGPCDIEIFELRHGRIFRLAGDRGSNHSPVWSLSGRVYFTSDRYRDRSILSLLPPEVDET